MELSGQFHGLAALTLGKEPQVSVEQELGWAPELVWMIWRRKISCPCHDLNPASSSLCIM
jgi:hypothetical protein